MLERSAVSDRPVVECILPGEQGCPARSARHCDGKVVGKADGVFLKPSKVGQLRYPPETILPQKIEAELIDDDQQDIRACFCVFCPQIPPLQLAIARATIPITTMLAARSLLDFGPSPNHMTPIIDAKITELSLSADTTPNGAIVFA